MDRKTLYWAVLVLFLVLSIGRLAIHLSRDDYEGATVWIALLIVLAICVVTVIVVLGRARGLAAHVEKRRPGARVVPAFSTAETVDQARAAGASARKMMPMGGSPVALAVVGDVIEVWVGRETGPRWAVRRTPGGVRAASGTYGTRDVRAVLLSDGNTGVTVVPAYRPLRAMGGGATDDVDRALMELGAQA